jgi:peptidoglycan/xylan/chitin deacetylase (PgdA/CDA1 family)
VARDLTTPTPLSRGEFGRVGARRLLDLLASRNIPSTWFTPGFTIESFAAECEAIVEKGHEIAHHSWAHVSPHLQSLKEEEADMVRAIDSIVKLTGNRPAGYRSPAWDLSNNTLSLLIKHGFDYDSSLMGEDYRPYRARLNTARLGEPLSFGVDTWIESTGQPPLS